MYTPSHFTLPADILTEVIRTVQAGHLVTAHTDGPQATFLPFHHRDGNTRFGTLTSHVMRPNRQWSDARLGESLVIVHLTDAYIDPTWLPSFAESRSGVPTWNYVTVHLFGDLITHEEPEWLRREMTGLCADHGFDLAQVPEQLITRMIRAVVGVEFRITRAEGKAKISQNKKPEDVEGIMAGLTQAGSAEIADLMAELSLPHARERWQAWDELAAQHRSSVSR